WKKATNNAAIWGVVASIPVALYLKFTHYASYAVPRKLSSGAELSGLESWLNENSGLFPNLEIPFLQQMLITALATMAIIAIYSLVQNKGADDEKGIPIDGSVFETGRIFNISAILVVGILTILYIAFW
ncbi:MAG: hypothetical protein AAFR59_17510, partial [Bacteroidota bacterium]